MDEQDPFDPLRAPAEPAADVRHVVAENVLPGFDPLSSLNQAASAAPVSPLAPPSAAPPMQSASGSISLLDADPNASFHSTNLSQGSGSGNTFSQYQQPQPAGPQGYQQSPLAPTMSMSQLYTDDQHPFANTSNASMVADDDPFSAPPMMQQQQQQHQQQQGQPQFYQQQQQQPMMHGHGQHPASFGQPSPNNTAAPSMSETRPMVEVLVALRNNPPKHGDDQAPRTIAGVIQCAQSKSWKSLLNLIDAIVSANTQPKQIIDLKMYRILALMNLRRYREAELEFDTLQSLDSPKYLYESYTALYPGKSGTMIPLALRFLHMQLALSLGAWDVCEERLHLLLNYVKTHRGVDDSLGTLSTFGHDDTDNDLLAVLPAADVPFFLAMCSLVSFYLLKRDFTVPLLLLSHILTPTGTGTGTGSGGNAAPPAIKRGIGAHFDEMAQLVARDKRLRAWALSKMGRVYLEIGDFRKAEALFEQATEPPVDPNVVLMNRGLCEVCKGNYQPAIGFFEKVTGTRALSAVNNIAICALYSERLGESVSLLEGLIRKNPRENLTNLIAFNLCTLYDLVSSNSKERKKILLDIALLALPPDTLDLSIFKT